MSAARAVRGGEPPAPDFAKLLRQWKAARAMYDIEPDGAECDRLYKLCDARLDELFEAPIATTADAVLKLRLLPHLIARDLQREVLHWVGRIAAELEALDRGGRA